MNVPTEPGWYWYKFGKKPWAIVKVCEIKGRLGAWASFDGPIYWLDERANGWIECVTAWSGPIQPPEWMT